MNARRPDQTRSTTPNAGALALVLILLAAGAVHAQQAVTGTRDPNQRMDPEFARLYAEWTSEPRYGSPLVDHLPLVDGIPTPNDVLGYHIGRPETLTYYEDVLRYYRALAEATPRVTIETIGESDEGRELVVVWISSEENIANLQQNRDNLARIADPRGLSDDEVRGIIAQTKPHYHLIGGLHSGEFGPPEMLMELAYRLVTETSPLIGNIRDNLIVSITPAAEPDGRDRNVDWFYRRLEMEAQEEAEAEAADSTEEGGRGGGGRGGRGGGGVPYWGKYVYHDNNRDINLSQMSMRAITDWYFTAHPPIMHDLHESRSLLYTYSGGPPQNPNLDPLLFGELRWFSNWELSQMTKWGMPGVYTHNFMDAWSPGYLGSVAYNHNGMMRMYETQSGRDVDPEDAEQEDETEEEAAEAGARAGGEGARAGGARGGAAGRGGRGGDQGAAGGGGRGGDQGAAGRGGRGGDQGAAGRGGRGGGGGGGAATGRGGGQDREWFRGIQVPEGAVQSFTRRNNTNYMQTAVLSALQLTAMFPDLVLENFYMKTRNSIEDGRTDAPFGYVLPVQRDMTRVVTLVNVLRAQGIEVGTLDEEVTLGEETYAAGSYVVKLDQPYGRLAKNLLERQDYPDPDLRTYDDSGWTMGFAFDADIAEIDDQAILEAPTTLVDVAEPDGTIAGNGSAGLAVAHYGSNSMITFRYRLRETDMQIAERSFTVDGVTFPAGSFIVTGSSNELAAARAQVEALGLTAANLSSLPGVPVHDGDAPRVAIYSQWSGTQELGWYRHAFDQFEIPFDLIYKEQVASGNLAGRYDVILMAAQNVSRDEILEEPAARPQPYQQSDTYRFLGMYGETPDMSGGFGEAGIAAIEEFLEQGGTLITAESAVEFPIEFGYARTIDVESPQGVNAQKPLIEARITRPNHPVFYGHEDDVFPIKFVQGADVFRVGTADEDRVIAEYIGEESSVLSGLMEGAENLAGRAFAVDATNAFNGNGRVFMFANNPIYRWQNHGEFNMVFNSILNWNDVVQAPEDRAVGEEQGAGGG